MLTAFRDGFQSVYGARVLTEDFLPAVEAARNAGITHFEAGGGARFQSLFFYCNENAFDMMDSFRETTGPDANLQTLSRGVNVVGLESQSSDIIKLHADLFKKHGMTTIRNFDALNDVNNLIFSGKCIKDAGLKHEVVVTMMSLPPGWVGSGEVHNPGFYCDVLKKILDSGIDFDSVCFKDASGTATPHTVYETIKAAREMLPPEVSLRFHTHDTAGTSILCNGAALRGGADGLDVSFAPVSGGTCQPDIITLWHAMRGTEYDLGIDIDKIIEAEEIFKECMADYFVPPEAKAVEPIIPFSPMPGGALTANTQMMRDNNILNRYPEVIRAMGEVVRRGGFGSSVTPVSQFYFQQAFNNVMIGPWKKIADGYGKMVLGYFGRTPLEPDPEIVKIAAEQIGLEPTTKTPLEINDADPNKGVEPAKKMLQDAGIEETDENIFIAATCKDKGITYLKGEAKVNVRKTTKKSGDSSDDGYTVTVNGRDYGVVLRGGEALVNGKKYSIGIEEGIRESSRIAAEPLKGSAEGTVSVKAPLPGSVVRIMVEEGDHIEEGDTILVMEAMKMETEIRSPETGTIQAISVQVGDQVASDAILALIK